MLSKPQTNKQRQKTLIVFSILQQQSGNRHHWLEQQNPTQNLARKLLSPAVLFWLDTMFSAITEGIMRVTWFTISVIINTCFLNTQTFSVTLLKTLNLEEISIASNPTLSRLRYIRLLRTLSSWVLSIERCRFCLATCSNISSLPWWKCFSLNTQYCIWGPAHEAFFPSKEIFEVSPYHW